MDKIYMNQLSFYGYHGVFTEENTLGQRFLVDLILELDLEKAAADDELEESVDYGEIYKSVKKIVEGKPVKLVETIAKAICDELLESYEKVFACTVKVIKPDPPIPGHYQSVAVELRRGRNE
ncbi:MULTISPECIES: dihydroneopterin aldolase [Shouchella]|uniref:7,8-dihydroneopterin aldolase n=2 Tax=Shouchella TaxID=2893057 RepID=A0ABY7W924_9BACI|nr:MULTISPECIES: dihydroneopterin aldolase [Shouchella]MED4126816.1 dihydroneopterin aldolase [Shouchella miscanthi]WDF05420.1 dihydroneopterin aldolase [Shouchella hunanensis]GAF22163.1 dihydroneopterin aldolase [Bacillus sp. JCM 19047]